MDRPIADNVNRPIREDNMLAETHSDKETILIRDDDRTYIGSLPSIELLANYYRWLPTPKGLRTNHQPTIDCVFETLEELEQLN